MVSQVFDKDSKTVQTLLGKAESQGYITLDDLMEIFPEVEENLSELEDLFIYLSEEGIQVLYGDDKKEPEHVAASAPDAEEPPMDEAFVEA